MFSVSSTHVCRAANEDSVDVDIDRFWRNDIALELLNASKANRSCAPLPANAMALWMGKMTRRSTSTSCNEPVVADIRAAFTTRALNSGFSISDTSFCSMLEEFEGTVT